MFHARKTPGDCGHRALPAAWSPTLVRDEMRYWLLRPAARLRRDIRCYFVVDVSARRTCKEELHLPDGYAELVFNLGASFDRTALGDAIPPREMKSSYVIGARSRSVTTRDFGNAKVIGVKLEPRMLHSLIRTPLANLRDSTATLSDLNDRALLALEDTLASCASVPDIVHALDGFFLRQQDRDVPREPMIDHCIERIRDLQGVVSIADWMRELPMDPRTLQRKFAAWIGMSPKTYARIVRFKHAYHRFITQCAGGARIDDYLDGYYDQSHFYKEFRYFTGTSPLALIAARTPASTAVTDHLLAGDLSAA